MRRYFSTHFLLTAIAVLAVMVAMSSVCANAQNAGAGTITGMVTDSSQAIVPNAKVTVTNTDTGVTHEFQSNGAGIYTAPFLLPGHYKVTATAANFGTVTVSDLVLFVGQTLTANAALSVQAANQTVEVSASNQILDTDKVEVSQVVDSQFVANLPVNTRNWSSFALMTPAVTQDGSSGMISFHGISGLYNQNYVDGANNNQMLFSEARGRASGAPYVYSVEAIKEFQSETSNYSVEFGQAAGGQVNAITKSGTNAIHGELFYYLRYPALNALDPYTKYTALYNTANPVTKATLLTVPTHQQQQFGGAVGGPIVKDKLLLLYV